MVGLMSGSHTKSDIDNDGETKGERSVYRDVAKGAPRHVSM